MFKGLGWEEPDVPRDLEGGQRGGGGGREGFVAAPSG